MRFGPRIQETTTTTGTSDYALAGAVSGHQTFIAGVGAGTLTAYHCTDGTDWETGYGTLSTGPDTLTRTVLASSNSNAAVGWGAGTKNIYSAPISDVLNSLIVSHKGSARPAWARAGLIWIDDSAAPVLLRYFDGTDDITLGRIDETNNRALFESVKGANIASSGSIDIGAATGDLVHITGTTTITALGTVAAGVERTLVFDGALTLTHNGTSLILPSAANIVTVAGDVAVMRSEGSGNWRCVSFMRTSGQPVVAARFVGEVFAYAGAAAPALSLLCYGQVVSQTTYAALYAVCSTTYNTGGEGAGNFRLPDLRGRVIAGQDDMGGSSANRLTSPLNGDTLGAVGGTESHTHAAGTLAASATGSPAKGVTDGGDQAARQDHTHALTGSTASGSSIQPTAILNYCIYAGV